MSNADRSRTSGNLGEFGASPEYKIRGLHLPGLGFNFTEQEAQDIDRTGVLPHLAQTTGWDSLLLTQIVNRRTNGGQTNMTIECFGTKDGQVQERLLFIDEDRDHGLDTQQIAALGARAERVTPAETAPKIDAFTGMSPHALWALEHYPFIMEEVVKIEPVMCQILPLPQEITEQPAVGMFRVNIDA